MRGSAEPRDPKERRDVDSLRQALVGYLSMPGIKAAMLVSDQGLVISSASTEDVDTAGIAALVIDTVTAAQRFGLQVRAGYLHTMTIEFASLSLVLAPFTPDVMLALVAEPGTVASFVGSVGRAPFRTSVATGTGGAGSTGDQGRPAGRAE